MTELKKIIKEIKAVDYEWKEKARNHFDNLTMPWRSLGELLTVAEQLAAIKETLKPSVKKKVLVTMAADHGVAEEGVSNFPQEVSSQMVRNYIAGGAAMNILAEVAGAEVVIVDMGVASDLSDLVNTGKILSYKADYGTKNMTKGPAMTRKQAEQVLQSGIDIVGKLVDRGVDLLATGDKGIGNTTASSAIFASISKLPVHKVTGRGTWIDNIALENKIRVIEKALEVNNPNPADPIDVLSKVGGFEIGGIAGVILGAAYYRIPIVIDGFISTAGALLAKELAPHSVDYMIAGHRSVEPGHQLMLNYLGLKPLLDLKMRLGEGTGACLAMNIVEAAAQIISRMFTFEEAGVSRSTRDFK
ncbi:MAG: nicotinate-nucleotide--dimethylbenzimidazole phosphoribosyltransferase [Clostridia bacterium]|nr:nicotinate-nucleotide--dimethylbenzimidazole phosphoribosyltransferase [Clostridia bacterium]